jgi:hypothetical protein
MASAAPAFSSYLNCEMTRGFTGHLQSNKMATDALWNQAQMKRPFDTHIVENMTSI